MKSTPPEEIDYVHADPGPDLSRVWECRWGNAVGYDVPMENEFPLHFRREHYDRTSDISHWHKDFYALYVVRSGRGTHVVNGRPHSMARGDVFLMAPDNTHSYRSPLNLTIDAVYFQERLWNEREWEVLRELPDLAAFLIPGPEGFRARGYTTHFGHLSPELHAQFENSISTMRREILQQRFPLHLSARARFYTLLVQLSEWRATKTFATSPARGAAIAEVLRYCDLNFHRPISTDQLAAMMHFSRASFFNVFTREVGMPPASYLRHLRLEHAQKLLEDRSLPIADVARLSGFSNATLFGRAFKKALGVSPLDFRRSRKAVR